MNMRVRNCATAHNIQNSCRTNDALTHTKCHRNRGYRFENPCTVGIRQFGRTNVTTRKNRKKYSYLKGWHINKMLPVVRSERECTTAVNCRRDFRRMLFLIALCNQHTQRNSDKKSFAFISIGIRF